MTEAQEGVLLKAFGHGAGSQIQEDELISFLSINNDSNRPVCVITSGGTQVPLETRMVRCIENFSTGRRGARMVEAVLDPENNSEYSVLLFMRSGTILPFAHNFAVSNISDALRFESCNGGVRLASPIAKHAFARLHEAVQGNRLLIQEYTTVEEYLLGLQLIATKASVLLKANVLFCLAAAVSDYYIPPGERNIDKIQSRGDVLTLRLHKVPKCLGYFKQEWAPYSFIASFKLETDKALLREKSHEAISKYGVDTVVANILEDRYHTLTLFDKTGSSEQLNVRDEEPIENELVRKLIARHRLHVQLADIS